MKMLQGVFEEGDTIAFEDLNEFFKTFTPFIPKGMRTDVFLRKKVLIHYRYTT